jgi:spermidine synthase
MTIPVLLLCIIIFCVFIQYNNIFLEKFDSFYNSRPKIKTLYYDKNGVEISELDNYGKCLIINNEIQLCEKSEQIYHEMIVHFPAQYVDKNIEKVVIIGGGDLMTLREVMKYKTIKKVYMLELSKDIVELCKKYFNQNDFSDNKKVEIIYGDANKTIDKLIENEKLTFDMVIVDTTEDNTENLPIDEPNFFFKCFLLLNDKGILVKNGIKFKELLGSYADLNTISYNVNIPYFQEKYTFTICGKTGNDIRKIKHNDSRWFYYSIKTKFYKIENHNKYIIYEDYKENKEIIQKEKNKNANALIYNENDNTLITNKEILENNSYLFKNDKNDITLNLL